MGDSQPKGLRPAGPASPKGCSVATDGWLKIIDIIDHAGGKAGTRLAPLVASARVDMFVELVSLPCSSALAEGILGE